jgi:hypothetical protein
MNKNENWNFYEPSSIKQSLRKPINGEERFIP